MAMVTYNSLQDLEALRSAPSLNKHEKERLEKEINLIMSKADWFTIGIMSSSPNEAEKVIRSIEKYFNWKEMTVITKPKHQQPVYLKANQKTGDIHIRVEHGLGVGILISCQHNNDSVMAETLGPLPLDFFGVVI